MLRVLSELNAGHTKVHHRQLDSGVWVVPNGEFADNPFQKVYPTIEMPNYYNSVYLESGVRVLNNYIYAPHVLKSGICLQAKDNLDPLYQGYLEEKKGGVTPVSAIVVDYIGKLTHMGQNYDNVYEVIIA